jgi:hypothetical protein
LDGGDRAEVDGADAAVGGREVDGRHVDVGSDRLGSEGACPRHPELEDESPVGDREPEVPVRGDAVLFEERISDSGEVNLDVAVLVEGNIEDPTPQTVEIRMQACLEPGPTGDLVPQPFPLVPGRDA